MSTALKQLFEGLERRATWRTAALAFGVILLSNVAMKGYLLPNIEARQPKAVKDGFLLMIDLAPSSSVEESYRIFDLYTPDVVGFVRLLYAVDFAMPLAFAFFFVALIGKLLRYLGVKASGWRGGLLLLPFVAVVFDYTENALALFLIGQYQDGQVFPTLARLASLATISKFVGLGVSGLVTVLLLVRAAVKLIGSRGGGARRGGG